jgi:predicted RNA-binding Zn ribbon-like protein
VDFVNTVAWRLDPSRTIERLPDAAALVGWCGAVAVLDPAGVVAARAKARASSIDEASPAGRARGLREDLYRVLAPVARGGTPADDDAALVGRAMTVALCQAEITTVVPWSWAIRRPTLSQLSEAIAVAVWRLFRFEDLTRLRECADGACGWLFLDRSRNASRRWCSSRDCGNRDHARRHYHRHHSAGSHHR